jgi:hypothetical protein
MKSLSNNVIAFVFGIAGAAFSAYIFLASRGDPGLRMAALVSATASAASLLTIASTLLTGKDVTTHNGKDLPPGATQVTQVPPSATTVTLDPTQPKE